MGCVGGTLPRWTAADKYSLQAIKDEWIFHIESSKPYRDPRINTRYIHPSTHRPIEIGESKYISRFSAFNFALRDWAVDNVRMTRIAHSFCFKWTPRIKHGPVIHRAILFIQRSIISWTGLWAEVLVFLLFFSWYFCFANNIKRNQTNVFIPFLSFLSLVFSRVQDSYCGAKILSFFIQEGIENRFNDFCCASKMEKNIPILWCKLLQRPSLTQLETSFYLFIRFWLFKRISFVRKGEEGRGGRG